MNPLSRPPCPGKRILDFSCRTQGSEIHDFAIPWWHEKSNVSGTASPQNTFVRSRGVCGFEAMVQHTSSKITRSQLAKAQIHQERLISCVGNLRHLRIRRRECWNPVGTTELLNIESAETNARSSLRSCLAFDMALLSEGSLVGTLVKLSDVSSSEPVVIAVRYYMPEGIPVPDHESPAVATDRYAALLTARTAPTTSLLISQTRQRFSGIRGWRQSDTSTSAR